MRSFPADSRPDGRPMVLVVTPYYLPGFRGGGPVRSLEAFAAALGDRLDIRIVCLDRDLGDEEPYPDLVVGRWAQVGLARVLYLPRRRFTLAAYRRLLRELQPATLYLNTVFSVRFTLLPLLAARLARPRPEPVIAARGSLSPGALAIKAWKKDAFLLCCRLAGVFRGVTWQASAPLEAAEIKGRLGPQAMVVIAPNLRLGLAVAPPGDTPKPEKRPGCLDALFLSRVSPKKNLLFALEVLAQVRGDVRLTVAGPVEDRAYWARCEERIARLPSNVEVSHIGPVRREDVGTVLRAHHVLLLPTASENFGHVIAESLSVGTPVVISDRTPWRGLRELGAGWDLPLEEPVLFVDALQALVDMADQEHRRLCERASAAAVALVDDDAAVRAHYELLAGRARPPAHDPA